MPVKIAAVGMHVPSRRVSNDELAKTLDTSDEWIYAHTGIRYRHIAGPNEAASDLGLCAAQRAIEAAQISPRDIDCIIVATSTPDYPSFPSTACVIQEHLQLSHIAAMDISAACSGFVYGTEIARALIEVGTMRTVLFIGTEIFSRIVDWTDRSTCVLFGDGAGAAIVSYVEDDVSSRIIGSVLMARGSGGRCLIREEGGSRLLQSNELSANHSSSTNGYLKMDGRKVYLFAVSAIIEVIEKLLATYGYSIDDLTYIVPHQANTRIIEATCKRKGWDISRFFINIDKYANTSAASIPIALAEMVRQDIIHRGDLILTVGFGAGLTYGGNLIVW